MEDLKSLPRNSGYKLGFAAHGDKEGGMRMDSIIRRNDEVAGRDACPTGDTPPPPTASKGKIPPVRIDGVGHNAWSEAMKEVGKVQGGHQSPFERIKRTNEAGHDFWSSRDLAEVLGYGDYRNFEAVVEKAKLACFNSGHRIEDHFVDVTDMVSIGSGVFKIA